MAANSDLGPGENLVLRVTRHPIVLFQRAWKGLLLAAALVVVLVILPIHNILTDLRWFGILGVALLTLVYLELQYILWRSESFTITSQRVILKKGLVRKFSRSVGLDRVQEVTTSQGLFGRMLGYGTVEVESAGKDSTEILEPCAKTGGFPQRSLRAGGVRRRSAQAGAVIRYLTAGESHGPRLVVIVDGLPAGLRVRARDIDVDLGRRQGGYGRGARQQIEQDTVEFAGGSGWGERWGRRRRSW